MIGLWDNTDAVLCFPFNALSKGNKTADQNVGNMCSFPNGAYQNCVLTNCAVDYGYVYNAGDGYFRTDGNNDYINCNDVVELNAVQKFTLEFTLNQDVLDTTDVIFYKYINANNRIQIWTHTDGKLRFNIANGSNSFGWFDYSTKITAGVDAHVVVVFDSTLSGDANRLKVFVNDELITLTFNGTIPATTANLSTYDAHLGHSATSFAGKIKWFCIYADALTPSRISTNYSLGTDMGLYGIEDLDICNLYSSTAKMLISDGVNFVEEIDKPLFGYKTTIYLPFTITKQSDGHYDIWDEGKGSETYDVRMCDCVFELNETEQAVLIDMLDNTLRGNAAIEITLQEGSGFHPFAPDKGDSGIFTVSMELIRVVGIGEKPYKFFHTHVRFVKQGSYPLYPLPAEVDEGNWDFGTVQNVRFPPDWFKPSVKLGIDTSYGRDGGASFLDKSSNADAYNTNFGIESNESKAAAIIDYIVSTSRVAEFVITTGSNYYAFAFSKGSNDSYNVKLIQNRIVIDNPEYNLFKFNLLLNFVSIYGA